MNEKVGFLNFYVQQSKDPLPLFPSERIADYVPALIFIYDARSQRIQYGNRKFQDFTGRRSQDLNIALEALVHSQDQSKVGQVLSACLSAGQTSRGQCIARLADRNGRYVFHSVSGTRLPEDDAENGLILLVANDITESLKSKEEIQTTRALLDETEELLQFGSWAWDIGTNTVTWTPGLYSLLGYTPEEVAGRIGFDFYMSHLLEEYAGPFQETIQRSLKEKTDFSCEYLVRTRDGVVKNMSTRGKLVKDESGEVVKILGINRDVTALRTFEKEQERSIRELNRSNRDLEEFAYIASHDLQEPLRKISMFTERLKAKCDKSLDKEGELFIERILASAGNMRTLIDNLLDFSRANRRSNTFDQVNIKSVLDSVISELELKIEETKAGITLAGNFPTLEAVPSEMKQLFGNMLSNAIKFRKSAVVPQISVQAVKLGKAEKNAFGLPQNATFHKIEIQDNGIGFEPEYSEKIFQVFQRLNGKAEYPGSGIGLAICKKIVEKHNGLVFAKSLPDQGATFTVILPEKQF